MVEGGGSQPTGDGCVAVAGSQKALGFSKGQVGPDALFDAGGGGGQKGRGGRSMPY